MGLFENFLLGEANRTTQPPLPKLPNQGTTPKAEDLPPDATAYDGAGNPQGGGAGANTFQAADQSAQQQDPNAAQDGGDPSQNPPQDGDGNPDQGDPNNQGDGGGEQGDAQGADPNQQQQQDAQPQPPQPSDEIFKQKEEELFSDLTPEQKEIKIKELKGNFKSLFIAIEQTIEKVNKISPTSYDSDLLSLVIKKLIYLRKVTRDYLVDTFNTRSYIKNKIELERFIFTFNNAAHILNQIYLEREKRKTEIDKQIKNYQKRNTSELPFSLHFQQGYDIQ